MTAIQTLVSGLESVRTQSFQIACQQSNLCAVLIQHIKEAPTLFDKIKQSPTFAANDLAYVLFQIYMPLAYMRHEFTHYDLHSNNALVYKPVKGAYIQYHYHMEGDNVVSFKSAYLAKIIDYGRCYFDDAENKDVTGNSKRIYEEVCQEKACKDCGIVYGFSWLKPLSTKNPGNYICSQIPNMSHDLRLLTSLPASLRRTNPSLYAILQQVVYKLEYGTPVLESSGLSANKIHNVMDACLALQRHMVGNVEKNEADYQGKPKLGDMHVYWDGTPIRYDN
jgi:hypothetical protein